MLHPSTVANAKPQAKPYKLADGHGLYLLIRPNGAKWWRFDYRRPGTGKRNTLSLGTLRTVSLSAARDERDKARELLADGIDPGAKRQESKASEAAQAEAEAITANADTFEKVARDWMAYREMRGDTAAATLGKDRWRLESYLFPAIGSRPIAEITPLELRDALRTVEQTGKLETAGRLKITAGQVFRWAVLEERTPLDITGNLRRQFTTPVHKHRATITDPAKIGELLRAIDGFDGQPVTLAALKLAPLVFVRPGELRKAEWSELDLDGAVWRIPAERMKMKALHIVPLSAQAVAILRELRPLTGAGHYVFPGLRTASRPMSENTVNAALRRLGYGTDEMTGHGFRSMAASRLNEMGWNADAIERQLAHAESNKVREAYTFAAQYLDERTRMMQAWADYLDGLRAGGDVLPFKRKAG